MPAAEAVQPGQPQAGQTDWKWTLARAALMYFGVSYVTGPNGPFAGKFTFKSSQNSDQLAASSNPSSTIKSAENPLSLPVSSDGHKPNASSSIPSISAWPQQSLLDVYLYISSSSAPSWSDIQTQLSDIVPESQASNAPAVPFSSFETLLYDPFHPNDGGNAQLQYANHPESFPASSDQLTPVVAVKWSDILLSDSEMTRDVDLVLPLDDNVKSNNGSIWADLFVTMRGVSPDPTHPTYHPHLVFRVRKLLTRLLPYKKKKQGKNLFASSKNEDEDENKHQEDNESLHDPSKQSLTIAYWHNNLSLALVQVQDDQQITLSQLAPPVLQYVHVPRKNGELVKDSTGQYNLHYPVVFPNDFWQLKEHMSPINETVSQVPLHIHFYHQSWFKFQMLASMSDTFEKQSKGATGSELDMIKTMLLETNPWFLALTVAISILHSLFEFLAFSSDVAHWRKKQDLAGVSVGSIITSVVVQIIITLYLLDNNDDTSWMILAGQAMGVLIEIWKLTKAITVGILPSSPGSWIPYRIQISDKHELSEEERKTQKYDKLAFKYVAMVAFPVLVAYTVYSALYETHRGWWSFIISTATSFVYAFGFVSLVPQLIVNYKLKSTAGMNSKTFVYKILGTFVDDLFAFTIKMPTLHRLACFRDDIVFFIFLYQKWIYGVDPTRRNEFGQQLQESSTSNKIIQVEEKDSQSNDQKQDEQDDKKNISQVVTSSSTSTPSTLRLRK